MMMSPIEQEAASEPSDADDHWKKKRRTATWKSSSQVDIETRQYCASKSTNLSQHTLRETKYCRHTRHIPSIRLNPSANPVNHWPIALILLRVLPPLFPFMFSPVSAFSAVQSYCKMVFTNMSNFKIIRHLTLISIVSLIVISVYYLSLSMEFLKKLIEHIEEVDQSFAKHAARNLTLSKLMFEPMQRNAHEMYQKHGKRLYLWNSLNQYTDHFFFWLNVEPATIVNIVSFSALIALSIVGLVVALRKQPIFLIVYGVSLDIIYSSSFLYVSRLKPWICAFVVFVSILAYIHSRQILIQRRSSKIGKVCILEVSHSDGSLIKDRENYKYEHASQVV